MGDEFKTAGNEDIERARVMVYEKITGNCAHKTEYFEIHGEGILDRGDHWCIKCGWVDEYYYISESIPSLSTSLDAWAEHIWPVMTPLQRANHSKYLMRMETGSMYAWDAKPLHHLEAALRALGLYEEWVTSNV